MGRLEIRSTKQEILDLDVSRTRNLRCYGFVALKRIFLVTMELTVLISSNASASAFSLVENNPVDEPAIFELTRRGKIGIVPSNVKSQSFIKTGKARFARLIAN